MTGKRLQCYTCGDVWVEGDGGRDGWCSRCFNPYHESGRVRGCQIDIECTVDNDFGRTLDRAMAFELRRMQRMKM